MPPKTRSIKTLATPQKASGKQKSQMDKARRFRQFHDLHNWLKKPGNWDGQTIVMPMPVNFLNQVAKLHWRTQVELKEEYFNLLHALDVARLMPAPPAEPPEMAHLSVTFYVPQLLDVMDNLGGRMKWPCDYLKERGWMVDDSPDYLTWDGLPKQEKCGLTPPRIEVKIL